MLVAIIVAGSIGYLLIGTIVGSIGHALEKNPIDKVTFVVPFVFWPIVLVVVLGIGIGIGPFLLIRKAGEYLTDSLRTTTIITNVRKRLP